VGWQALPLAADADPTRLGGLDAATAEAFTFRYSAEDRLLDDGRLEDVASGVVEDPRYRLVYDPFDRLIRVDAPLAADDDDGCLGADLERELGDVVFAEDTSPVASRHDVLYDALGRRIAIVDTLPGCDEDLVSRVPVERPRSLFYLGEDLVAAVHYDTDGQAEPAWRLAGESHWLHGPDDDRPIAWLFALGTDDDAPGGRAREAAWVPFADLDGGLVAWFDVAAGSFATTQVKAPWFRGHPVLVDAAGREALVPQVSLRAEVDGFGELRWTREGGYVADVLKNRRGDHWYSTLDLAEMFAVRQYERLLQAAHVAALAVSWIPVVGEAAGLLADLGDVALQIYQEGPSWGAALSVGTAALTATVSLAATLAGPPGRAGAPGRRQPWPGTRPSPE